MKIPTISRAQEIGPLRITRGDQSGLQQLQRTLVITGVPGGEGGGDLFGLAVATLLGLELDAGEDPGGEEVVLEGAQHVSGLIVLVPRDQQASQLRGGVGAGRIELERAAKGLLVVSGGEQLRLGRRETIEEGRDLRRRDGAGELGGDLAVLEGLDGGDALNLKARGELLVGVDVDLGELHLALALRRFGLQGRPELAARAAPLGPEVDDHGHLVGALEHVLGESILVDVVNHAQSLESARARASRAGRRRR